ncbi:MAG: hypothetical protein ACPGSF_03460, partial [Flavobacteriaceae bacterium]
MKQRCEHLYAQEKVVFQVLVSASEMIKRIHLPKDDKKHMPPIGGNQLTRQEIEILDQWIS